LVVCPAVVVENWARETARFAPSLRVGVFHGAQRRSASALAEAHDLVITTYDLLRRDRSLREQPWHRVVLDEAQAIKNPKTKVAIAARELVAPHRLALTGTPVENHLGDLWSIMQFVEPGLLGKRSEFTETFVVTNEPDPEALLALQRITRPVLLRRSKRDPGVADDLPDKIEMRVDCALTPEQVALYDATTEALITGIADVEGIVRRGQVLAALTRLKQICAHPWLITKEGSLVGRSGKFERLCELVDEIVAEGDAAIIFTQFAQLVDPISSELSRRLGRRVVSFTGKTGLVGRQVAVDEFSGEDGPPLIVISKLAGGKGINLVRANHVIHYDHWWNPAVEDQASDRAWRIGQHRTVEVHDMICPGTLEDRIAALLARKRELASQVTGLSDLVDLDTESLRELVSLGRSELIEVGAS
jgi:non-specific serine/threonine protein kinase